MRLCERQTRVGLKYFGQDGLESTCYMKSSTVWLDVCMNEWKSSYLFPRFDVAATGSGEGLTCANDVYFLLKVPKRLTEGRRLGAMI